MTPAPLPQFAAVLQHYGPDYRPLQVASPVRPGFSGAEVWRIDCAAGAFALRRWPPATVEPQRIRGLHRLLASIRSAGMTQVAVPVAAGDGATLVAAEGRLWQLEPWLPGTADFHRDPNPERLRAAMTCLAAWHRAAASFVPRGDEAEWFGRAPAACSPAVVQRLQILSEWTRPRRAVLRNEVGATRGPLREVAGAMLDAFERSGSDTQAKLRAAAAVRVPLQTCLRDVWHDHLLFSGDAVTGLIDPSACGADSVAIDLARLLGSLLGDRDGRWAEAIAEYGRHRPLSLDEAALVPVLDRSQTLLAGMTWLDRHFVQRDVDATEPRVLRRLQWIRERMERLQARRAGGQ